MSVLSQNKHRKGQDSEIAEKILGIFFFETLCQPAWRFSAGLENSEFAVSR